MKGKNHLLNLLLLLLLLSGCQPKERILTPLVPDEHVQTVTLSDGFLFFNENDFADTISCVHVSAEEMGVVSQEYAQNLLGFDLEAACSGLPAHLRFTWDNLVSEALVIQSEDEGLIVCDGVELQLVGEPTAYFNGVAQRSENLTIRFNPRDRSIEHYGWNGFTVLPWDRRSPETDKYYQFTCEKSFVGDTEVGLYYDVKTAALWPDYPDTIYYAGFYIDDLAITLESHFSYCTQEEFIQVLLTILDAAAAQ